MQQPTTYSDDLVVCCWCCAQDPITMTVEFPKLTLIPGEQIDIKAHLSNLSSTNVEGVSFELNQVRCFIYGYLFWVLRYYFQKITYKVTEPNKDDKIHVNTPVGLRDVGLGAHGENTYIFKVVLPPDCLLPNFTQCGLFSVQYEYKVRRNNFKYMFQIHAF